MGRMDRVLLRPAAVVVLFAASSLSGARAPALPPAAALTIRGRVTRAVTGSAVRNGEVEVRWPAHDDQFEPVRQELSSDGTFELSVPVDTLPTKASELSIGVDAEGFAVAEMRLSEATWQDSTAVTVELELTASTLDGVLDIFACCILSWSVLTVMLPAFLLGAAVKAFVPGHVFLKYLGPTAPKRIG